MWRMLQAETPDDFVLATNETHTVRKFVELSFKEVGMIIKWQGEGVDEVGINQDGKVVVRIDPKYFRPTEVDLLLGDSTKAKNVLGWTASTPLETLVKEMVAGDLQQCNEKNLKW